MYQKKITYTDFDGTERTETFLFNLTKAELMRYQQSNAVNAQERMEEMANAKRVDRLMREVEDLVRRAYGERSEDGRKFIKNKDISDAFMASEAYSAMLMEFLQDDGSAVRAFVEGIMPADLMHEVNAELAKDKATEDKVISFSPNN